jgi:hypothetical protein
MHFIVSYFSARFFSALPGDRIGKSAQSIYAFAVFFCHRVMSHRW